MPPRFKRRLDDLPPAALAPGHTGGKFAAMGEAADHVNAVSRKSCRVLGADDEIAGAHTAPSPFCMTYASTIARISPLRLRLFSFARARKASTKVFGNPQTPTVTCFSFLLISQWDVSLMSEERFTKVLLRRQ